LERKTARKIKSVILARKIERLIVVLSTVFALKLRKKGPRDRFCPYFLTRKINDGATKSRRKRGIRFLRRLRPARAERAERENSENREEKTQNTTRTNKEETAENEGRIDGDKKDAFSGF
jgi:hypothetical protein